MKIILSTLILMLFSIGSSAFDTKTHVWVSQQVLNDLSDGTLDIGPFKGIPVDEAVKKSILSNPRIYRMGNVGPDGFPDLISGQQTTHPGIEGGWNTDDWLKHIRTAGDSGSDKMRAFAYGYLGHASADTFAHTYVNWYAGDAFSLGNGVEEEIRHTLVEKFIAKHQPDLVDISGNTLGSPESLIATKGELPIMEIAESLVFSDDVASQYSKVTLTLYLAYAKYLYDSLDSLEDNFKELDKYNLAKPANEIQSAIQKLYKDQTLLPYYVTRDVTKEVCKKEKTWGKIARGLFPLWGWQTKTVCKIVTETIKVVNPLVQKIDDEIDVLIDKQKELTTLHFWAKKTIGNWKDGIYKATSEYLKTSSLMAQGIMSGEGAKAHFDKWKSCYMAVFIGMPYQVNNSICYASKGLKKLTSNIAKMNNLTLVLFPGVVGPLKIYSEAKNRINDEVNKYIKHYAEKEFGKDVFKLVAALKGNVTDDSINYAFTQFSGGSKGLLKIADVATRIKSDMALDENGKFTLEKFNVVNNAVILAKLSLLNHTGINDLITKSGSEVFAGNSNMNILDGFLKSIDGNHQWFTTAPAYPRENNLLSLGEASHRVHGYNLPDGFLFWNNVELRNKIFRKIFKGPIAPGLEYPQQFGLTPILSKKYSYQTCSAIPFPNQNTDSTCLILPLIPILSFISN